MTEAQQRELVKMYRKQYEEQKKNLKERVEFKELVVRELEAEYNKITFEELLRNTPYDNIRRTIEILKNNFGEPDEKRLEVIKYLEELIADIDKTVNKALV